MISHLASTFQLKFASSDDPLGHLNITFAFYHHLTTFAAKILLNKLSRACDCYPLI